MNNPKFSEENTFILVLGNIPFQLGLGVEENNINICQIYNIPKATTRGSLEGLQPNLLL